MPDVTVINDLNEDIHIAFFIGVPTNWKNQLKPKERWTMHLASLPLHFKAHCVRSPGFSHNESWKMFATIGGACAAGTASVVSSATPMVLMPLMVAANAGEFHGFLVWCHIWRMGCRWEDVHSKGVGTILEQAVFGQDGWWEMCSVGC
ncbi:hypothetical protein EDB19DRAFT_1831264 [Suillus lakei]|nr:hypothetical protein EDB19DRAFT_1831264 [Suillus lakei]